MWTAEGFRMFIQWLWPASLNASVVIGLILGVRALLQDRFAIRWTYWLWLFVLVRMLMPWAPQSAVSVFNLWSRSGPVETSRLRSVLSEDPTGLMATPALTSTEDHTPQRPNPASELRNIVPGSPSQAEILAFIWLAGALGVAGFGLVSDMRLWLKVRTLRPVTDGVILELFEDCKTEMGVHTLVGLILTDRVSSPCIFGVIRPRVLLPVGSLESLTEDQLRFVFLHELAHLKRWDNALGWFMLLAQVLHWFNPLVWYSLYRMRTDRELACDYMVLSAVTGKELTEYGSTIMDLSTGLSRLGRIPSVAGIVESRSLLKRRIKMIAEFKPKAKSRPLIVVALLFVAALVTLTDAQSARPESIVDQMSQDLFDSLLLYYSFDKDGGSRAVDISGMDFHGKNINAKHIRGGRRGGALVFNGKDSQIVLDEMKLKTYTFAAWVKANTGDLNNRVLFQLYNGEQSYSIQGAATFPLDVYVGYDHSMGTVDETWAPEKAFPIGQWVHLTVTYDGDSVVVYRNGRSCPAGSASKSSYSQGPVYIGGAAVWKRDSGGFWQGAMDEVALFNQALSASQVQQLYGMYGPAQAIVEATTPGEWIIEALIDDTSELWLYADRMVWHNLRDAKPGRHGDRHEPTLINGTPWIPTWQKPEEDGGTDVSLPYEIKLGTDAFNAELIAAGKDRPLQTLDRDASIRLYRRDGASVIRFEDVWGGPAWMKVKITNSPSKTELAEKVSFLPYRDEFQVGDSIEIDRIEGTASTLMPGHTYSITGHYTLSSCDQAQLHVYATNGETQSKQGPVVKRGSGRFTRTFKFIEDGYPHLSYYPTGGGSGFGGVYFRNPDGPILHGQLTADVPSPTQAYANSKEGKTNISFTDLKIHPYPEGGLFQAVASIRNTSDISAGQFRVYFYVNDPEKKRPKNHGAGPIQPGKTWNEGTMPFSLKEGVNTLEVVIDSKNEIQELDETDNQRMIQVTVKEGRVEEMTPIKR